MEKTRVPKGERYWFIAHLGYVFSEIDTNHQTDKIRFEVGNYFHSREDGEFVAKKLRAVLKGAEVIEMPSEEEIKQASYDCTNGYDDDQIPGFIEGVKYLKSKIVK